MQKFKFLAVLVLCLLALSTNTTAWAQNAAPKPNSNQQWLQDQKAKQANMLQQRANPASRQGKAAVAKPAANADKKATAEKAKNDLKPDMAKRNAKPATVATPEQRLAQVEKDLAYIRSTGKGTEKLAKLEAELSNCKKRPTVYSRTNEPAPTTTAQSPTGFPIVAKAIDKSKVTNSKATKTDPANPSKKMQPDNK